MENTAEKIHKAIARAPLLSVHAQRLLQICASTDHDIDDVLEVVRCDATLTARVLRVVNSSVYGLLSPINTIDRAVAYLGERMVTCIALGESAGKLLKKPLSGYEAEGGELWKHDLYTGFAAREIARRCRIETDVDLAFTAGLLHDIGKAIIADFLANSAEDFVGGIARGELADYVDAERQVLGFDHCEVGLELARQWKLPNQIHWVVAWHHHPQQAPEEARPLVYAVHLGDILAMMAGYGTGSDSLQYAIDQDYVNYIDLTEDDLSQIMLTVEEEFDKAIKAMAGEVAGS
ncbi:putative nucleotidyltransferase with HDIG domain [Geothermobacter ehrlichii]|uniref:Putative nucleotidyltransferase with HDIG domain n=1 Tax=Geothermobacter ehrlichii TaxID=213224 RepID=A0A5D3WMJ8_9BACT|nr:HDOD domain-containing protein [Geothermobacter ehrlichii]TYP00223.1 putative nucleotidyltransferase with HDIG domain [Geothermobacter ehrlichii]